MKRLFLLLLNLLFCLDLSFAGSFLKALDSSTVDSYVVQFKSVPNQKVLDEFKNIKGLMQIYPLVPNGQPPFNLMYKVETSEPAVLRKLKKKKNIGRIEKVMEFKTHDEVNSKNIYKFEETFGVVQPNRNDINLNLIQPPITRAEKIVNDLFFNYQWGLFNQEPTIYIDQDDITSIHFKGKKGMDVGWARAKKIFANEQWKLNRNVVVAVIDSGVNLSHPDLEENIFINEKECQNGRIRRGKATEDKDENGFKGDCMGWNFTVPDMRDGEPFISTASNRPFDDKGHGTHVAGIIAAVSNNGEGISGFSNNIKILPIKVVHNKENAALEEKISSLTDRVAKGIHYAIKMKADVINISMGWPFILQTDFLKKSFEAALKEGITIVAAIGNNEINKQIFPCALKGVFCVGSVDADGKISEFSNFGGHVDFMAPGDNILSLYPMTEVPIVFSVQGYEIKSGTSQAAPYVAGMAAVLKGVFPGISNDEIYARLTLSGKPVSYPQNKFTSGGLVDLEKAIKVSERALVKPDFNEFSQITYSLDRKSFDFLVPVKNYWQTAKDVTVKIDSLNSNIRLSGRHRKVGTLNKGQTKNIRVVGELNNLNQNSEFTFSVTISGQGLPTKSFKHTVLLTRDIKSDSQKLELGFKDFQLDLSELRTVTSYDRSPNENLEYYTFTGEDSTLTLYTQVASKIIKKSQIKIPHALRLLMLTKVDLDYDGNKDFFIRVLSQKKVGEEDEYFIDYYYLNESLGPLFNAYNSSFEVIDRQVLLNPNTLRFYKGLMKDGRPISLPIFLTKGSIPEKDRNPRRSAREDLSDKIHVYYFDLVLENGKSYFEPRVFTNYKLAKTLSKIADAKYYEDVEPVALYPQVESDLKSGVLDLLMTVGQEYSRKFYRIVIENPKDDVPEKTIKNIDHQHFNFQDYVLAPYSEISENTYDVQFDAGINAIGFFNNINSVSSFLNKTGVEMVLKSERQNKRDHFVNPIHSFKKGNDYFTVYLTKSKLYVNSVYQRESKEDEVMYSMSAFLPGKIFKQFFYPVVVDSGRGFEAGIYVNDTQFNGNHIFTRVITEGKILTPTLLDVHIPDTCRALNPVFIKNGTQMAYSILCDEKEGATLSLIPMEY